MEFKELLALVGLRTDSPAVVNFAESNGVKLPLKRTADSFNLKKHGLVVSWDHEVLHPDFYPPKKENKKYIAYITSIWFSRKKVKGLPHGLAPHDTWAESQLKLKNVPHEVVTDSIESQLVFSATNDERISISLLEDSGCIKLKTGYRYDYLKSDVRAHAFSPWDNRWPNEQADLPNGMFMAWCIHRDWVGLRHLKQNPELVQAVKERKLTGREFLYQTAFCNEFWSHDIHPEIENFAFKYLRCLCNRNSSQPLLGKPDRCGVDDDFMAVFNPLFKGRGLQAADDWVNYDRFSLFLDARWYDYQKTGLTTDVEDAAILEEVETHYKLQQQKMQALPAAVELHSASIKRPDCTLPDDASSTLLSFLGRCVKDDDIKSFLDEYNLDFNDRYIDAPHLGFFLRLDYPWNFSCEQFEGVFDKEEQLRLKRKKMKYIETIYFTNTNYEQVSNSTGNFLLCEKYLPTLPFNLNWDMSLQDVDKLFGEDEFEEHTWETYGNDGSLSRAWSVDLIYSDSSGHETLQHYRMFINFDKFRMVQVKAILR